MWVSSGGPAIDPLRILKDNSTYRIYISKENRPFRFILFMSLLVITDLSSDRIITAEIFLNMHH